MTRQAIMGTYVLHEHTFPCQVGKYLFKGEIEMVRYVPTIEALGDLPFQPGSPGGEMKCPACGQHTPDSWSPYTTTASGGFTQNLSVEPPPPEIGSSVALAQMYCANDECKQLMIRVQETSHLPPHSVEDVEALTKTWLARPRNTTRTIDLLVREPFRRDYLEAAAILDASPRMSGVLSRKILGDLLERYAGLKSNSLKKQVDAFIGDTDRPYELRENLHYLREMGDFGAHTQTDDERQEIIDIGRDEAEWTLDVVDGLFDYFIVSPERSKKVRGGMAEKIKRAGRDPIPPLPDAPQEES
jgi:hypothetical protein